MANILNPAIASEAMQQQSAQERVPLEHLTSEVANTHRTDEALSSWKREIMNAPNNPAAYLIYKDGSERASHIERCARSTPSPSGKRHLTPPLASDAGKLEFYARVMGEVNEGRYSNALDYALMKDGMLQRRLDGLREQWDQIVEQGRNRGQNPKQIVEIPIHETHQQGLDLGAFHVATELMSTADDIREANEAILSAREQLGN